MVSLPLKRGSVRSNHECGLGRPSLAASTVLKHTAATQASMPTQAGGLAGSRKAGLMRGEVLGRVGLEQAALVEQHHRGDGEAPDRVAALRALLGQDAAR